MLDNFVISNPFCLIFENNVGVLILNGRGPKYSNFQILVTESLNK